jgi:hypothetical protein
MDENLSRQILDDLLPSLEALDTKASALLQLLKDKGIATPEEITSYLDLASNGSNVRWRAARVRLDYLLSSAAKPPDQAVEKEEETAGKKSLQPADNAEFASQASEGSEKRYDREKTNPEKNGTKATPAEENEGAGKEKDHAPPEPTAEKEKTNAKQNADDADNAAA